MSGSTFDLTPYEELPIEELGIEELESRLEMSGSGAEAVDIFIEISVSW